MDVGSPGRCFKTRGSVLRGRLDATQVPGRRGPGPGPAEQASADDQREHGARFQPVQGIGAAVGRRDAADRPAQAEREQRDHEPRAHAAAQACAAHIAAATTARLPACSASQDLPATVSAAVTAAAGDGGGQQAQLGLSESLPGPIRPPRDGAAAAKGWRGGSFADSQKSSTPTPARKPRV